MAPSQSPPTAGGIAAIMVSVDLGTDASRRIALAGALADRFSAHLIGVAAEDILPIIYGDAVVGVEATLIEAERLRVQENLAEAEQLFKTAVGARENIEWRAARDMPFAFLAREARAADILVVGRRGRSDADARGMAADPADLVLDLGRPVLVVPPEVAPLEAHRVIIAWKDTCEARRAVHDSLPLLRGAETVIVVAAGASADGHGADDVATYLKRHGVTASAMVQPAKDVDIADVIIDLAGRYGADLIVAGAYGHSRMREWVFGGVTRDLLDRAPICCLLSH